MRLFQSDLRKQSCFYSRQIIIKQMVDPQFAYFPFWEDFVESGISNKKLFPHLPLVFVELIA